MHSSKVLSIAQNFVRNFFKVEFIYVMQKILRYHTAFLFTEIPLESISAISTFLNTMENMSFNFEVAQETEDFFTSDEPINILANWPCKKYKKFFSNNS